MPDPITALTVLGFDYGTRWIGCAAGQSITATASPLSPIAVHNGQPDWTKIQKLIGQWQPDKLIVGHPSSMTRQHSPMTARAERFSRQLQGRFNLPCELIDERLTTRESWQIIEASDQHYEKPEIDSIAAVLITETWLHEQH